MNDGIYINAWVVRVVAVLLLVALGFALKEELPAARRYIKMEMM